LIGFHLSSFGYQIIDMQWLVILHAATKTPIYANTMHQRIISGFAGSSVFLGCIGHKLAITKNQLTLKSTSANVRFRDIAATTLASALGAKGETRKTLAAVPLPPLFPDVRERFVIT
jgi:hypothetical protein